MVVVTLGLRARPWATLAWAALGVVLWTWVEYMVHRYVLHGRFPDGPGWLEHRLHRFFDTMHGDHHLRPWDGMYINGYLDSLPFAILFILLSFLAPLPTAPVMVASLLQCYVIEEWVHYTVHFHRFRSRYFVYIRRHHLYHHSPRSIDTAFGLTGGLWDMILGTRVSPRGPQAAVRPPRLMSAVGRGVPAGDLTETRCGASRARAWRRCRSTAARVLVLIPDGTRTMPMPLALRRARARGAGPAGRGPRLPRGPRHAPPDERRAALAARRAARSSGGRAGAHRVFNHRWDDPAAFATLGTIPAPGDRDAHRRPARAAT